MIFDSRILKSLSCGILVILAVLVAVLKRDDGNEGSSSDNFVDGRRDETRAIVGKSPTSNGFALHDVGAVHSVQAENPDQQETDFALLTALCEEYERESSHLLGREKEQYQIKFIFENGSKFKGACVLELLDVIAGSSSYRVLSEASARLTPNLFAKGDEEAITGISRLDANGATDRIVHDAAQILSSRSISHIEEVFEVLQRENPKVAKMLLGSALESNSRDQGLTDSVLNVMARYIEEGILTSDDMRRVISSAGPATDYGSIREVLDNTPQLAQEVASLYSAWIDASPGYAARDYEMSHLRDKPRIAGVIAAKWSFVDPQGAGTWVESLSEGVAKDNALMALGKQSEAMSIPQAVYWMQSIGDSAERSRGLEGLRVRALGKGDHDAADRISKILDE